MRHLVLTQVMNKVGTWTYAVKPGGRVVLSNLIGVTFHMIRRRALPAVDGAFAP
ncbi:MAG: hypothetical protein KGN79_03405 [Acidobacteriota bacterium]|nr:hypothetical protein [Acidobacteriota bacterium]